MKFVSKYISMILLLFCAMCAEAQSFTSMRSQKMVQTTGVAQAPQLQYSNSMLNPYSASPVRTAVQSSDLVKEPQFEYSNSMLDRNINVRQFKAVGKQQNASYSVSPIRTALQPVGASRVSPLPTLTRTDKSVFSGSKGDDFSNKMEGVGDLGIFTEDKNYGKGDWGEGDYRPGEYTPLGDYLVPMLILLLCYSLFLLVRGEAREEREEEMA